MKTILKTFAAIGFALVSFIVVATAAVVSSMGKVQMDYIWSISFIASGFGALVGWYRVK